jgi:hypothetical protein
MKKCHIKINYLLTNKCSNLYKAKDEFKFFKCNFKSLDMELL